MTLLLVAVWRAREGAGPWVLWRTAVLTYLLYAYASMALGAAYNPLFLLYVATYSTSLFALWLSGAELVGAAARTLARTPLAFPRRGAMWLLTMSGIFTGLVWTLPLLLALVDGTPPALLGQRTTMVTDDLDLGLILPGTLTAAGLIRLGRPLGWAFGVALLGILVMLLPSIVAATVAQLLAGIRFTWPEILGPIIGFLVFGVLGAWVLAQTARALDGVSAR